MKKTRVQKMYKRFKNRVLRRKPGVEEKKQERLGLPARQQLKLISSEPLTDLRTEQTIPGVDDAAVQPPSCHNFISRHSQCTVQSAADTLTTSQTMTATLTSLPSRAACSELELEDSTATILSSSTAALLCSKRREGPCQSLAVATHSSSTATDDRGRQHGTPTTTTAVASTTPAALAGHPMLSADSGVEVDVLESCSGSCADDVFATDDEEEDLLLVDDDGWQIAAHDVSLDKILHETSSETVYSGYWHGSVEVHSRRSSDDELIRGIDDDVQTLSCIRHENIQLFLGVCHDLHSDYISIVMDQTKGQSLHSLIHRRGHQFSFQSATKIMSQIAQGMEYLHAKGISHPLLTSRAVTVHYRVCISMLTPCGASQGLLDADDVIYLPPEAARTVSRAAPTQPIASLTSSSSSSSHQHRSAAGGCSRSVLKADSADMHTDWANVFSFGTLVYEMMTMERPFAGVPTDLVIWEVGNERAFPLRKLHEGCRFRQIVGNCWRGDPERRPSFEDLLLTLENNMSPRACGLKSPFSFSEPSQLAKLGL